MKKSTLTTLLTLAMLAGCTENIPEKAQPAGINFVVETLFTHEGCTVYKFKDSLTSKYYAKCEAPQSSIMWTESCGKSCSREMHVPTSNQ